MAAVCVANWLPRKGILELLEAVAGLPDDVVTLHLVGDTATRGGYARRCARAHRPRRPAGPGRGARPRQPRSRAPHVSDRRRLRAAELRGAVRNRLGRGDGGGTPGGRLAGGQPAIPGRSRPRRRARARGRRPRHSALRSRGWPATQRFASGWDGPPTSAQRRVRRGTRRRHASSRSSTRCCQGTEQHRLDKGPVEVKEDGARHDPSPTGRSTDAQASADS